jgi:hypothetical protein
MLYFMKVRGVFDMHGRTRHGSSIERWSMTGNRLGGTRFQFGVISDASSHRN